MCQELHRKNADLVSKTRRICPFVVPRPGAYWSARTNHENTRILLVVQMVLILGINNIPRKTCSSRKCLLGEILIRKNPHSLRGLHVKRVSMLGFLCCCWAYPDCPTGNSTPFRKILTPNGPTPKIIICSCVVLLYGVFGISKTFDGGECVCPNRTLLWMCYYILHRNDIHTFLKRFIAYI